MKKLVVSVTALLLLLCACTALAWDYEYDDLPEYIVCSEYKEKNRYLMYVYADTNSQGTPIAGYENGTVVKMITLDANHKGTYSYILGPDNVVGYAWTARLVETGVTDSINYPYYDEYIVTGAKSNYCYLYAEPSSQKDPVRTYNNGTTLRVVSWDIDKNYCFVIGPDLTVGYVQKKVLTDINTYNNGLQYVVTGVQMNYAYLYSEAGSSGNPKAKYNNGTIVTVLNWNADPNYCLVRGSDNQIGYIQKKILTYIDDYYAGKTPTPMPATPTPTPRPTTTPTPWYTATPRPTATPTMRPTPTPTIRPTATATPANFWNAASYQLLLTKYNSATNTYTTINGTTAYMADLGVNESYRLRLHITNTCGSSIRYAVSANLNGTNYTWNTYTLGGYKSVYHNLGASLTAGTNYVTMYVDGITACSGWYNIVASAAPTATPYWYTTPTPTPTSVPYWYNTPTPTPTSVPYWYNTPTPTPYIYNSIYGHWLRINDDGSTDDLFLDYNGNAVWNGLACTWTNTSNNITTTTYWGSQSYTYTLSGNNLYMTSSAMGLRNAQYIRVTNDTALVGKWVESGTNNTITLQSDTVMKSGSISYSWAVYNGQFYMSSLWGSETYTYYLNGSSLYLYKNNAISKVYYRTY